MLTSDNIEGYAPQGINGLNGDDGVSLYYSAIDISTNYMSVLNKIYNGEALTNNNRYSDTSILYQNGDVIIDCVNGMYYINNNDTNIEIEYLGTLINSIINNNTSEETQNHSDYSIEFDCIDNENSNYTPPSLKSNNYSHYYRFKRKEYDDINLYMTIKPTDPSTFNTGDENEYFTKIIIILPSGTTITRDIFNVDPENVVAYIDYQTIFECCNTTDEIHTFGNISFAQDSSEYDSSTIADCKNFFIRTCKAYVEKYSDVTKTTSLIPITFGNTERMVLNVYNSEHGRITPDLNNYLFTKGAKTNKTIKYIDIIEGGYQKFTIKPNDGYSVTINGETYTDEVQINISNDTNITFNKIINDVRIKILTEPQLANYDITFVNKDVRIEHIDKNSFIVAPENLLIKFRISSKSNITNVQFNNKKITQVGDYYTIPLKYKTNNTLKILFD